MVKSCPETIVTPPVSVINELTVTISSRLMFPAAFILRVVAVEVISPPITAKSPEMVKFPVDTSKKNGEVESVPPRARSSVVLVK